MDGLLGRLSSRQLAEWQAYDRLDPFGLERFDLHAAMLLATIRNALRGEEDEAVSVEDCMPRFGTDAERYQQQKAAEREQEVQRKMQELRQRLG